MTAQPRYLLDTDICVYIRRERPQAVMKRFKALPPGAMAISVITYGELAYGVRKGPDPRKAIMVLDELIALIPVLPMATDVAETYGTIRSGLAARGELIGNNDLWIAAHANSLDVILVTNNEKKFQRVSGLKIENWAKG
ncbi:type II toxin-antitoxin system VapC family toxin [Microvirga sp. BT689]|uniref:type II toxin-antitoxin system tRNA(fMet)-specific endonuclease VapC n=1 Tax=Microvirga arvi TaxID=2778731 RepID=UPI0019501896|nr:type II toxin-antitoxin system VapC family toxin [Microvirga arvi]MBM6582547.1 type II toxin-antitoxin system VapC family toxin [Microvirga arvi]